MRESLTESTKVYAVIECGGDYEEGWEHIVGVCSTPELADELKAKTEDKLDPSKCPISEDEWNDMWESLYEEDVYDTVSSMKKHFPQYSEEDLSRAMRLYDDPYSENAWVRIEEIDFYTSLSNF